MNFREPFLFWGRNEVVDERPKMDLPSFAKFVAHLQFLQKQNDMENLMI
jgi:hypothetical protein